MARKKPNQERSDNPVRNSKRTTMQLSLSVVDKMWLQKKAAEEQTTVAAIIRGWIAEHRENDKTNSLDEAEKGEGANE